MSETAVEQPVADLATLQKELEELAAQARSDDRTAGGPPKAPQASWGK